MTDGPATPDSGPERILREAFLDVHSWCQLVPDSAPRVIVRGRELFLDADDPLASRVSAWLGQPKGARGAELRALSAELAARLRAIVTREPCRAPAEGAAGPLPTAAVLMEAASLGDPETLLAALGGPACRYRAGTDRRALFELPGLDPESMFLLSRFDGGETVDRAVRQAGLGRGRALQILARLRSVGLLVPFEDGPVADTTEADTVRRFSDRIGQGLVDEPVRIAPELHRSRVSELLAAYGGRNHYELLEVAPSATVEEVHAAYERLARLIHPSHARRLELTSAAPLEMLFERATEAYRVLTDPDRRSRYNLERDIDVVEHKSAAERRDEQRRLAGEHLQRARQLAAGEQFHYAIELLREAVRLDPRAETYALLGACLAHNSMRRPEAVAAYTRAAELDPGDAGSRVALGQLCEALGDVERARAWYIQAVELSPGLPEATLALEQLGSGGAQKRHAASGKAAEKAAKKKRRERGSGKRARR